MNDETSARTELLRSSSDAATRVFATILTRSPISRVDVARLTGLSQAAVTRALSPLIGAGFIDDSLQLPREGLPGRPANPVAIVPNSLVAIGIKVNADELIGVASDITTHVLEARRMPLSDRKPETVINAIVSLCVELEGQLDALGSRLACIGVSVSGDVDVATGRVRESAIMGWKNIELGTRLSAELGPVTIENDARALTIGEHWFGAGVGTTSFAIVTMGRGIGSGLHINGDVVEGAYGVAGEIGHVPLTSPDRICACGRRGCVEAVASTGAILSSISLAHDRPVGIEEAVALARSGDIAARSAFGEAAHVVGIAIASIVNLIGPEVVIIGGEAVTNFDLFEERLFASYKNHVFGSAEKCRIVVRPHTFEDWARGAAAAAIRALVL